MNLKCEKLDKYYGNTQVLKNVNFECKSGEITGIIGRNGAGKTVLFKAICGLISNDSGKIYIDELEKKSGEMMKSAGIIIEEPAFLSNVSGIRNLKYLYMINNKYDSKYISSIMEKVRLDEPFNGLDNHGVEEMRFLLQEMKKDGKTILVVSHNAEDIRILCDNVFQMDDGILTKIR